MLLALLEQLHSWCPQAEFLVTANNPVWVHSALASATHVVSLDVPNLLRAILACDVVILGGGTHFHNLNKNPRYFWLLLRYLMIFLFARIGGKRVYLVGIGIGPLETEWARFLTISILRLADFVLVRDTRSHCTALSLGCERAYLGFDLSCLLVGSVSVVANESSRKVLGISVLPAYEIYYHDPVSDLRLVDAVASAALVWLNKGPEYCVRLIEFKGRTKETDFGVTTELRQRLSSYDARIEHSPHRDNPRDMLRVIGECDALIAMRYHACLFSYLASVPAIFIEYHRKNASLAEDVLLPPKSLISLQAVTAGTLADRMEDLLQSPDSFLARTPVDEVRSRLEQSLACLKGGLGSLATECR